MNSARRARNGAAAPQVDLGLGGAARWSTLDRNATPRSSAGVVEALDAHDRSLGLDAGGTITGLARDAARSSASPVRGTAQLDIVIDGEGKVTRVRVTGATSEIGSWQQVADALDEALRKRVLRVPPFSHGIAFAVEIESRSTLASGHDAETELSVNGVPLPGSGHAKNPVKLGIILTPVFVGIGGNLDETDLAWRAQRQVTARVTNMQRL